MKRLRLFHRLCFFVFCLLILFRGVSFAVTNSLYFLPHIWQSDQGLPHNLVNAVLQTSDGYIWVGTRRGVARFDGIRFVTTDIPELKIQNVTSLCEDAERRLWIATEGGVYRLTNGDSDYWESIHGLVDDNVRTIFPAKDGSVWMGTAGGLTQYTNGILRSFTRKDGLPHDIVRSICEAKDGALWIATDGGLCHMRDGRISVPESAKALGKGIRYVCFDRQDCLWVGTQNGVFYQHDGGWKHVDKSGDHLSDNFVSTMHPDRNGRIWIGTYGGLDQLAEGRVKTELTPEGAAYDQVNDICEDREGNLWIGSKDGLTRLKVRPFTTITKPEGLTYNNVMSVLQDKTGTFWAGTWGGGLFRIQEGNAGLHVTNVFPNSRILSLCESSDGGLWFGTDHGGGLYRFRNGAWTHHDAALLSPAKDLERVAIPVLLEDRHGELWIGTPSGLIHFTNGKFRRYTIANGLAGDNVRVIFEDEEGNLWIGTNTGLSRRSNGNFTNFTPKDGLAHDMVLSLHEDNDGNLWIGTAGGGLNRLRKGKFTTYSTKDGLFSREVLEILEDDSGDLWMTCLKGIYRVSKSSLDAYDRGEIDTIPCTAYGKEDGMLSIICSNVAKPAAWKGKDGRLWFATTKGIAIANHHLKQSNMPVPMLIESVVADKKRIDNHSISSPALHLPTSPVVVPAGRGELEIHYTGLDLQASEKTEFRYKLERVDPDWIDAKTRRVAYYNNIAPGRYIFRVTARNAQGVWNKAETTIELRLLPRFWQTIWFRLMFVGVGICTVAGGARVITKRKLQRQLVQLQQQHAVEKERARIAQDMHDDLGVRLSEILLLSKMTERESRAEEITRLNRNISQSARELVDNLDAIVWAVNPKNDSLETLVNYLFEFVPGYLGLSQIRTIFDVPMNLPDLPLSSETRHNLFLVIKEALCNIVKHSGASEVHMGLVLKNNSLRLSIRDNGNGFTSKPDSAFGNGLINMKQRMVKIGGCIEIESHEGNGCTIRLQIAVTEKLNT